jgi:cytochrome b involved in lipid metabolism
MSNSKISIAEIDKHATADNCWIVVNGKVYDLTTFAPEHPGGPDSKPSTTNYHQLPPITTNYHHQNLQHSSNIQQ